MKTDKTFVKKWKNAPQNYFQTEATGLKQLQKNNLLTTPFVVSVSPTYIKLEFVEETFASKIKAYNFGVNLAKFHNISVSNTKNDTFIKNTENDTPVKSTDVKNSESSIPIKNSENNTSVTNSKKFEQKNFSKTKPEESTHLWGKTPFGKLFFGPLKQPIIIDVKPTVDFVDYFFQKVSFCEEIFNKKISNKIINKYNIIKKPSYLHGDLWNGNLIWSQSSVILIDPAPRTGNRFEDLAMLKLFGCQYYNEILEGYNSVFLLPNDFEKHIIFHNLFPVLAHYVLFGGLYLQQFNSMIEAL